MAKAKPKSIYPPDSLWSRIKLIASATNNVPSRVAVRFMERGAERWERRQHARSARTV